MGLKGWFRSKRKLVKENETLKREIKNAHVAANHFKRLLDRATVELRSSLDKMAGNFAMIKMERDVALMERYNAVNELFELKRSLQQQSDKKMN